MNEPRPHTTLAIALLLIIGSLAFVSARDDGRYANSPLKPWFDQLASGKGLCCSFADGIEVEVDEWDNRGKVDDVNSGYRVRLNGQWVDVPKSALVTEPNKAGSAYV
jgi:hypothetical protein